MSVAVAANANANVRAPPALDGATSAPSARNKLRAFLSSSHAHELAVCACVSFAFRVAAAAAAAFAALVAHRHHRRCSPLAARCSPFAARRCRQQFALAAAAVKSCCGGDCSPKVARVFCSFFSRHRRYNLHTAKRRSFRLTRRVVRMLFCCFVFARARARTRARSLSLAFALPLRLNCARAPQAVARFWAASARCDRRKIARRKKTKKIDCAPPARIRSLALACASLRSTGHRGFSIKIWRYVKRAKLNAFQLQRAPIEGEKIYDSLLAGPADYALALFVLADLRSRFIPFVRSSALAHLLSLIFTSKANIFF